MHAKGGGVVVGGGASRHADAATKPPIESNNRDWNDFVFDMNSPRYCSIAICSDLLR
jgi:hypothetical protein